MLTIFNVGSSLPIVNGGLSITIVNETTNFFWKDDRFWKKNFMQLYCMSSYMKLNSCGGSKTSWYFLKNYSLISTDAIQVGFLSSLTIVNEESYVVFITKRSFFNKMKTLTYVREEDREMVGGMKTGKVKGGRKTGKG